MRTFKELLGWALWPCVPLLLLGGLGASAQLDGDPRPALFGLLIALLVGPGIARLSRRLRDPAPEELAEADGRRPVLLLHRFTRSQVGLLARLFVVQPAFWRDLRDGRIERALGKSLGHAGPVVPLARPGGSARSGPVALLDDSRWREELERRLKPARLVAIALDETAECVHEVERALEVVGPTKVILVVPAKRTAAFLARFESLHRVVPELPALSADTLALRFGPDRQPLTMRASRTARDVSLLGSPAMMLFTGEARPAIKPPVASWLLTLAALGSGVVASVAGPTLLDAMGVHVGNDGAFYLGLLVIGLGGVMAVLSRRAVALVPSHSLPMLTVAATPWLLTHAVRWIEERGNGLEPTMHGAAYSYALLVGAAFVLAGGALIRRAPGRRIAFGMFGVAALIPIVTLWASLVAVDSRAEVLALAFVPIAAVLALVVIAASGEGARAHAPLPLGAATAATLAVAAVMTLATARIWRSALRSHGLVGLASTGHEVSAAFEVDRVLPWFLCAIPLLVALVATLYRGRVTRVSGGSALALAPMLLLLPAQAATHDDARRDFSTVYRRSGAAAVAGFTRAGYFETAYLERDCGSELLGSPDAVLNGAAILFAGSSSALAVSTIDAHNLASQAAVRRANIRGSMRLMVSGQTSAEQLRRVIGFARALGHHSIELVGASSDSLRAVRLPLTPPPPSGREHIRLFIDVQAGQHRLLATDGTSIEIPYHGSQPDYSTLRERLAARRAQEPSRRTIELGVRRAPDLSSILTTVCTVSARFDDVRLSDAQL